MASESPTLQKGRIIPFAIRNGRKGGSTSPEPRKSTFPSGDFWTGVVSEYHHQDTMGGDF
jgi:hypothetical protein